MEVFLYGVVVPILLVVVRVPEEEFPAHDNL
jgi:hypothetical protein